jgi:hypothetical protein
LSNVSHPIKLTLVRSGIRLSALLNVMKEKIWQILLTMYSVISPPNSQYREVADQTPSVRGWQGGFQHPVLTAGLSVSNFATLVG